MLIAYGSDIHDEVSGQKVIVLDRKVDVLVLAGDITQAKHLAQYAAQYLGQADHVVVVLGNHEIYGEELNGAAKKAKSLAPSGVHILDRDSVEIMDWKFIGATAWTNYQEGPLSQPLNMFNAQESISDFKYIRKKNGPNYRKLVPADLLRENAAAKDFIFREITPESIVVTHHAPTHMSIGAGWEHSHLNAAYVNNWGNDIAYSDGPALWFHGHIHQPADYMVGDTRVVCNPIGYPGQIPGSGFKYVEV